jgi:hypothetical protein
MKHYLVPISLVNNYKYTFFYDRYIDSVLGLFSTVIRVISLMS